MLRVLSLPPGGDFSKDLFQEICTPLQDNIDCLFAWRGAYNYGIGISEVPMADEIVANSFLFIERLIKNPVCILWVTDNINTITKDLEDLFRRKRDTNFILVTSLRGYKISAPNCIVVDGTPDLTHHQSEYPLLSPVLDKNLDSDKTFISLSKNPRTHRYVSLCLLLAYNLENYGKITFLEINDPPTHQLNYTKIIDELKSDHIDPMLFMHLYHKGHTKLNTDYQVKNEDRSEFIYAHRVNDNPGNFKNRLSQMYKNSFIEFINETTWDEEGILLTEKTLNSIYGCNFPIWVGNRHIVRHIKAWGIDVFDDIINHDYQHEKNKYIRIKKAIELNYDLLTNPDKVKRLWIENKHRFEKNVEIVRGELYNTLANQTKQQIINALKQLNINYEI